MTTNTLGSDPAFRPKTATAWLLPFAPMGVAAFSLSALVFFHLRQDAFEVRSALQHCYAALYRAVGFAPSVMFFGLVILWSTIWLANGALQRPLQRLGRLAAMTVMLGVLLNLGDGGVSPALHKGAIGAAVAQALVSAVGYWPSLVLVWAMTFASLLLATDFFFQESFERLLAAPRADREGEVGVEAVAADRLRESGHGVAATASVEAAAAAASVVAPAHDRADAEPPRRRRSYDERRAEREAMASRWSALAAAPAAMEPSAVEPAPADSYELSAARVVDAIDAAADAASAAVEGDVPEALQRDVADDGYAAGLGRAQRTPIVFPDEAPAPAAADALTTPTDAVATSTGDDGWPAAPTAAVAPDVFEPSAEAARGLESNEPVAATRDEDPAPQAASGASEPGDDQADIDDIDGDDALGLGDDVLVLADPSEPGFPAQFGSASEETDVDAGSPAFATASDEDEDRAATVRDDAGAGALAAAAEDLEAPGAEPVGTSETAIAIPRPEAAPAPVRATGGVDEALVREAIELVTATRRANTVFLQRKLRIDYDLAAAVLAELAARGIVALDAEATHGRVLA